MILTNRYQGFDPRKNVPRASWSSWDEMQKPLFLTPNVVSFWIIFTPYHFGTHKKSLAAYTYQFLDRLGHLGTLWLPKPFLQKSDKGQVFYWSSQTSTRFSRLVGRLVVTMLKKASKLPYFRLFQPDPQILSTLLPYTDLEPPSSDPVPPSTN